MRIRRIAVLIDGGFFLKRLPKLVEPKLCADATGVAECARFLCKRHVQMLIHEAENAKSSKWLDHVYRLFYYDANPYDGTAHHPITNLQIQFAKTPEAQFRRNLFNELRRKRKFAIRLGHVALEDKWQLRDAAVTKKLLRTRELAGLLNDLVAFHRDGTPLPAVTPENLAALEKVAHSWSQLGSDDVRLAFRQKGVDMRIGIDITTLTLKRQVDTIVLVTGDSDFVPAAKVARREGVEFLLDPLWQSVTDDLNEHVDGVQSGFKNPDEIAQSAAPARKRATRKRAAAKSE